MPLEYLSAGDEVASLRGWRLGVRVPSVSRYLPVVENIPNNSEVLSASYSLESGLKRPQSEADHSLPSKSEVNNKYNHHSTAPNILLPPT